MPKKEVEFSDRYLSFPSVNFEVENSVPINTLEKVADAHAYEVWGKDIARGPPIPAADKKGDLTAYIFPYVIGRRLFPDYAQILKKVESVRSRHQEVSSTPVPQPVPLPYSEFEQEVGRYGSIYVSARRTNFPILKVSYCLHPFFLSRQIAQENAEDHLKSKEVGLRKIYFLGPHEEYFEFASLQTNALIHINSLERKKPEDVLIHEPVTTPIPPKVIEQIEKSWANAIEPTPEGIDANEVSKTHTEKRIPYWELIPVVNWTCWCVPTSLTMVFGFWDNYVKGKGTITGYGRLIDYWLEHVQWCLPNHTGSNPIRNVPNLIDKIIDPKTGTWAGPWLDTINKLNKYNFTSKEVKADSSTGWAWNDLKQEIDNGRPVVWSNSNHAMAAFGYRITSSGQKFVILYNTYGSTSTEQLEEWNYAQCTGIQCVYPGGGTNGDHLIINSPDGGETIHTPIPQGISWYTWGKKITKTKLSFSEDGGKNWSLIANDLATTQGWNLYTWVPGKTTGKGRILVQGFTDTGELIASDGTQENFSVEAAPLKGISGKINLLRVHDLGTGYGPPSDFLDVEAVVRLDSDPNIALGFQLRKDPFLPTREKMLSVLRKAYGKDKEVRIDYFQTGPKTGIILRVWIEK